MWMQEVFRCRPLDRSDFAPRADGLRDGWPMESCELDAHIADAGEILGLSGSTYEPEKLLSDGERLVSSDVLRTGLFRLADLSRFRAFADRTIADPNVTVVEDTHTLGVRQDGTGRVVGLRVAGADGTRSEIECRTVVLAAGGLENARLLLVSTDCGERGIGNASQLVGQGFMEHPHTELGHLVPADGTRLGQFDRRDHGAGRMEGFVALTDAALLEHHLPEVGIWLHAVSLHQAAHDLRRSAKRSWTCRRDAGGHRGELAASARRLATTAMDLAVHPRSRTFHRLVSCELEQFPTTTSSVTLGDEVDRFGQPRVHVHWELGADFDRLHDRLLDVLIPAFRDAGVGELVPFPADSPCRAFGIGNHHMGTTRMSACASHGVVDTNCGVHDAPGLHVVGTSVFPTSGAANPTLTAVAMALRLGDHLAGQSS